MPTRRTFLRTGALAAGALAMGPSYWRAALAQSPTTPGVGPYGPLGAPNALGVAVPEGFTARLLAQANLPVAGTGYLWPLFPDGSASFPLPDGGYVLAINSEVPGGQGGASAVRFDRDGGVVSARRILGGTSTNCGGGGTPWGTWLSGEEVDDPGGFIWECDPLGEKPAVRRDAMGRFKHEAAAVDPVGRRVYLSEDLSDSAFYRFTPNAWPDLSAGTLEVATGAVGGVVTWVALPDPTNSKGTPTRKQVPGSLVFKRGEGIFFDSGVVYLATTSDDRIYAYDTATERLDVLYDGKALGDSAPLHQVDNVTVHPSSGDLFVCEDADDLQICLITGDRTVAPFVQLTGPLHTGAVDSETTGVTFDPSGKRMYFSSQRAGLTGMTFEVTGPFRTLEPRAVPRVPNAAPATDALVLRAKPAARLSTLRREGLKVAVVADRPGTYAVRVRAGGKTLATARRTVTAVGRVEVRARRVQRFDALARALRGRKVAATIEVVQGARRVSRPLALTRGR